jgi:DNA recombination protein RmuC
MSLSLCIILFILALDLGLCIGYFAERAKAAGRESALLTRCSLVENQHAALQEERSQLVTDLQQNLRRVAELETRLNTEAEARELLQKHYEQTKTDLQTHFRATAADVLERSSRNLKSGNEEQFSALLGPLKEQLNSLKLAVQTTSESGVKNATATQEMIRLLMDRAEGISKDAAALTQALRGDSKVQGDWGEAVMERMFESAGLTRGTHYEVQKSYKIGENNFLRPDAVLRLPQERSIILDSKVSLTAYVSWCAAADDAARDAAIKAHVSSVNTHIRELGSKSYEKLEEGLLDYVLMFIPNEGAYIAAVQHAPELVHEATRRKVLLVSPSNLVMALQLVHFLWQKDAQQRNLNDIVERAGLLYDKFALFQSNFINVGESLRKALSTYETADKQLSSGKGNYLSQVEKLRELGVTPAKQLKITQ